jgi:glyoxylase-like metal-dependent hydrolase (beta-lactamase superfamily II)
LSAVKTFEYDGIKAFKFGYHPFAKPAMWVYVYYVDGLLIDTGQSRMRNAVIGQTKNLNVKQIFLTHHHEDHTGNVASLAKYFACPVYASPECIELMKEPPRISFAQWMVWGDRPAFSNILSKTDTLETDYFRFNIIPVPGHAADMVVLYEPTKRWLFASDLFVNEYISYFLHSESMLQQIQSIRTVLELDFEVLFCGHNPIFENGETRLRGKLDYLENFYQKVMAVYDGQMSANEVFVKLKLKENWQIRLLSHGYLSKLNMVRSVIRDIEADA